MLKKNKKWTLLFISFIISGFVCTNTRASDSVNEDTASSDYTIYNSFKEMINATDTKYFDLKRISPAGTEKNPMYHGFFFYNCSHHEQIGRASCRERV